MKWQHGLVERDMLAQWCEFLQKKTFNHTLCCALGSPCLHQKDSLMPSHMLPECQRELCGAALASENLASKTSAVQQGPHVWELQVEE